MNIYMEIFNSKIAGLLGGYSAITLGFISLYKRDKNKVSETTRVHESIHRQQWRECFILLSPLFILGDLWCLLPILGFYIWYLVEYFISVIISSIKGDYMQHKSYRSISFEMEAYDKEGVVNYLSKRKSFAWVKYLGKI